MKIWIAVGGEEVAEEVLREFKYLMPSVTPRLGNVHMLDHLLNDAVDMNDTSLKHPLKSLITKLL